MICNERMKRNWIHLFISCIFKEIACHIHCWSILWSTSNIFVQMRERLMLGDPHIFVCGRFSKNRTLEIYL